MLEKYLERKLVNAVEREGGIAIKLPALLYKGIPDRMILHNGHVVFVEMKQEGKRLRPEQEAWKKRLENLGFKHFIIDNEDKINSLILVLREF